MPRIAHALQINLGLGKSARELLDFPASLHPSNLARKYLNFFR
jgi:hypothetical protein